jgi:hypothetical protein
LAAHPPDGLEVARLGDADDDRREQQRDDQALDELDERLREEAKEVVGLGVLVLREEAAESTPSTSPTKIQKVLDAYQRFLATLIVKRTYTETSPPNPLSLN